jgi:hypothetical protein
MWREVQLGRDLPLRFIKGWSTGDHLTLGDRVCAGRDTGECAPIDFADKKRIVNAKDSSHIVIAHSRRDAAVSCNPGETASYEFTSLLKPHSL